MNKRIVLGIIGVLAAQAAWSGQELALALKNTAAPDQEFIRTPAKYIFKKLSDSANLSGDPALASFTINNELASSGEVKVSIDLANMNLFDALNAVAKASGSGVEFQQNIVVLKDPSEVEAFVFEDASATPEPVEHVTKEEKDTPKRTRRKLEPNISFADVSHALVFVENGDGRGSGFIAEMDGVYYVFSNQHNFLGAKKVNLKTMNGTYLKPTSFEYSRTHDLVRLRLESEDIDGLSTLKLNFDTPPIHEEIVIYGNSAGGGVATELEGEIIGVGPADIEITAKMVPGNSGSPILNQQAEVIGVATYATLGRKFEKGSAYDKMFKGTRFSKVRRYGIRIPQQGWISDSMTFYLRQTYQLEDMKTYILAIYALQQYWTGNAEYNSLVNRMFSTYASIAHEGNPPFEFKMKNWEERLREVVRSFKLNHEDLMSQSGKRSTRQGDDVERLKRILSTGVEEVKSTADTTHWKSNLLKHDAHELKLIADEIIHQISNIKNPYGKKRR